MLAFVFFDLQVLGQSSENTHEFSPVYVPSGWVSTWHGEGPVGGNQEDSVLRVCACFLNGY